MKIKSTVIKPKIPKMPEAIINPNLKNLIERAALKDGIVKLAIAVNATTVTVAGLASFAIIAA